jgi:hypothetical protein
VQISWRRLVYEFSTFFKAGSVTPYGKSFQKKKRGFHSENRNGKGGRWIIEKIEPIYNNKKIE